MLHYQGLELLAQDHTSQILNSDRVGTREVPSSAEELLAIDGISERKGQFHAPIDGPIPENI